MARGGAHRKSLQARQQSCDIGKERRIIAGVSKATIGTCHAEGGEREPDFLGLLTRGAVWPAPRKTGLFRK